MADYVVQHRRGTAAQWAEKDTVIPYEGELVIEIDKQQALHKLKIGDGIHSYSDLAYLQAGDEIVTQVLTKTLPRIVVVTLDADRWVQVTDEESRFLGYYAQEVALDDLTNCSRLDLQPSTEMLVEFQGLNLIFVTENKCGVVTVYSIGDRPLKSYTMQATIVETDVKITDEQIVGIPVGVTCGEDGKDGYSIFYFSANEINHDSVGFDNIAVNTKYGRKAQAGDLILIGTTLYKVTEVPNINTGKFVTVANLRGTSETWTFELEDGTTVTKEVVLA